MNVSLKRCASLIGPLQVAGDLQLELGHSVHQRPCHALALLHPKSAQLTTFGGQYEPQDLVSVDVYTHHQPKAAPFTDSVT